MYASMYVCMYVLLLLLSLLVLLLLYYIFLYLCFRSYEPAFRVHETCEYPPLKPHHSRVISFESD